MIFGDPPTTFVYHVGVHCTDDDMLVKSLLRDGVQLQDHNVIVARPRRYRKLVRDRIGEYRGDPMPEEEQRAFFDELLMGYEADRVFLSDQDYLTQVKGVFDNRMLYGKAGYRAAWLRYLFPENPCEFFLAIRNPATFLPAAMAHGGIDDYEGFIDGTDPLRMRWSGVVERIVNNNPGCPVTVWCNEDTPMIWPELLRAATGVEDFDYQGENDVLASIISETGLEKLRAFLAAQPPKTVARRRQVVAAFLDKFALEEAWEEEIDLPGWTPDLVEEVTALYDEDVDEIAGMDGVRLISI